MATSAELRKQLATEKQGYSSSQLRSAMGMPLSSFRTSTPQMSEKDTGFWEGVKGFGKGLGSFLVDIPQSILRTGARGVMELQKPLDMIPGVDKSELPIPISEDGTFKPKGFLQQAAFGKEDVLSFEGQKEYSQQKLEELGVAKSIASPLSIGGVALFAALDAAPTGKGAKAVMTKVASEIAESSSKTAIKASLKSVVAGSDTVLDDLAERLIAQTDPKLVEKTLRLAKGDASAMLTSFSDNLVERGFVTSSKEAVPEAAARIMGEYIPRSTDELSVKAYNLVRTNLDQAWSMVRSDAIDDKSVAVASELMKKYSDDAAKAVASKLDPNPYYDNIAEIANTMAPKLTEVGRTAQAASILGRMTPEGQVRFLAKEISRYNDEMIKKGGKAIPGLTKEEVEFVSTKMKEIAGMADGIDKARAFKSLQDTVLSRVPSPFLRKVVTVWKAGLLTGLKTSGVNLFSNLSHFTTETVKDAPAAVADSVMSLVTGKRTKTFTVGGSASGMKEGLGRGWRFLKTGFDERNVLDKLDYKQVNFGKGPVGRVFQTYTNSVFRVLGSSDQPFYYGALTRSLTDQAIAAGKNSGLKGVARKNFVEKLVANPSEEMIKYAVHDATTAVFQQETVLAKMARGMTGSLRGTSADGALDFIIPFSKTPAAVVMQMINYTPVGPVKEIITQALSKKFDQRLMAEALGRGITGTAVAAIGWNLAKGGLIAEDYPTDERTREQWALEGKKPNTIYIDGEWRSPMVLGPVGPILLMAGHLQREYEKSGTVTGAVIGSSGKMAKTITEQTFLTGVNNVVSSLNDPGRYMENFVASLIGSTIPTIVSDVAQASDPTQRRLKGDGITETVANRFMSRIPGLRQTLEPRIDVLGNDVPSPGNWLETLMDPTRPSASLPKTPLIRELDRLEAAGYQATPTLLGDSRGFATLTDEQNTSLLIRTGELTRSKLSALLRSEEYRSTDDEGKKRLIDGISTKAKDVARAEVVIEIIKRTPAAQRRAKLSELKKSKLLTKTVLDYAIKIGDLRI